MSSPANARRLSIAISGGGLAGAAIALALQKEAHLDVHIYESAPTFSERGAAVGLAINAQRALDYLVPSTKELLKAAGAVPSHSTRVMIASGPQAGTRVVDIAEEFPVVRTHRAALLQELLAYLPESAKHTSKKLVKITTGRSSSGNRDETVTLKFEDGSTAQADALIGADGIFGTVRQFVLDAGSAVAKPVAAGWNDSRNLISFDRIKDKLGAEYFKEPRQYAWVGDGGMMMHDTLDDGRMAHCVAAWMTNSTDDASKERKRGLTRQDLENTFKNWLDGPIAPGMIDLLMEQDQPAAYGQWEHLDAPTYAKGAVCIAGDAAHAMTPWQGSGAGCALEDAVVLGALFAHVKTPTQIDAAFKAFDLLRRPRTQAIAESSRETGKILSGRGNGIGLDPEKMREGLSGRWDFIYNFDLEKHRTEAVTALQQIAA